MYRGYFLDYGQILSGLRIVVAQVVEVLFSSIPFDSVTLLEDASELFPFPGDFVELVVRELTPLSSNLAFELLPFAGCNIGIHKLSL
jgi:hypothetical protein